MYLIYQGLSVLLLPAILLYWIVKMAWRGDYMTRLAERFGTRKLGQAAPPSSSREAGDAPNTERFCFWIHAVSVGEVNAATPLVRALQARFPRSRIVLSTMTPAGRATAQKNCPDADVLMYFPVDFFLIVDRVISRIKPTLFLPVETDIWPTLIRRLSRRGVAMILVNGRVSLRRLKYRRFFRPIFRQISFFCMQTDVDVERLIEMGVDRAKIAKTGNMKFCQAVSDAQSPRDFRLKLPSDAALLIAGSTHEGEELELLACFYQLRKRRKDVYLLIAPRHLERLERLEKLVCARGFASARWSRVEGERPQGIIFLDTMGELAATYPLATAVFVGGSWVSRGGHNVLEPAAAGKPVFFGPHMENYSSIATNLIRIGAAIQVKDGKHLAEALDRLLDRPAELVQMGEMARNFVLENQDVVERNLEVIERHLRAGNGKAASAA